MSQLGTLYQYEIKKILKRKMTWIAFCGVMLIIVFLCYEPLLDNYTSIDARTGESVRVTKYDYVLEQQERAERFNGRIIDDTLLQEMQTAYMGVQTQEMQTVRDGVVSTTSSMQTVALPVDGTEAELLKIIEQQRQYEAIYNYIRGVVGNERVHTVDAAAFYGERQRAVADYERILYLTEGEKQYWRENEVRSPYAYYWDMGPDMMLSSVKTILALTALMIGMVFSGVFADERMRKTDQLVLCSRHGRGTLYLAKLLAVATLGTAATFLVSGITMLSFGVLYGYEKNWNAPLQIYLPSSPFALTMGEAIVILMVLLLLAAALHSVLTLVLSSWTRSSVASISLMVVYTLGTMLVNVPERLRFLSQSLYLMPAKLVRSSALCDIRLVGGAGHYLNCWQMGMLLYPLLILVLALLGGLIYRRWQISGR
ncbi:MAG: ABC transporter permease subunit [Lachnospiraceae bacterium]|nr:ABC transporter permease subunit [Lachnospiraceae bacterium]